VDVEVRFKAVAGKTDQAAGIAVRLTNADNYYVARANALEDNVRFYRVVDGRREQLDGVNLKVIANEWHRLACARKENTLRFPMTASHCSRRRMRPLRRPAAWPVDQVRQCDALRSVVDYRAALGECLDRSRD